MISSADLYGSPDSTRPTFAILDDDTVVVKRGGNKNDFGEWYDENACNKHWPFINGGSGSLSLIFTIPSGRTRGFRSRSNPKHSRAFLQ